MEAYKDFTSVEKLYREAETTWTDHFAEQRNNILLVTGKHFQKRADQYWEKQRERGAITEAQRIRFTKNHVQVVTKAYVNYLISSCPGVRPFPANENELKDKKAAELNWSVTADLKRRLSLKEETRRDAHNFVEIGEVVSKIFWDENKGRFLGYQETTEKGPDGVDQVVKRPMFTGDLVAERIHGFNFLIDPAAKSWADARYAFIRKLVDIDEVKAYVRHDKEKLEKISEATQDAFQIFDVAKGGYAKTQNKTELIELYVRPCVNYPMGLYVFFTSKGELARGELPAGIFPLVYKEFDEIETTPRGSSIIRPIRPLQGEINRAAGKRIEHMLTVGDDKMVVQGNTTVSQGGLNHGIRTVKVNGAPPTIIEGRTGDQYAGYNTDTISELYQLANLPELDEEKPHSGEPLQTLYTALRKKKKFAIYLEKFVEFQAEKLQLMLRTAKEFMPDSMVIPAIGRAEAVNIAEFRATDDLSYQIKMEEVDDDIDTAYGKQVMLSQLIQYIGPKMERADYGKVLRAMPFLSKEELLQDFTMDYDNATNDILALDRGEWVEPSPDDDHGYLVKRLTHRMKLADFRFLPPLVQEMYAKKRAMHEQAEVERLKKIRAAQSEFIPTGGFMVACDFYVPVGDDPSKTKRVRIPSESLNWLIEQMRVQGSELAKLEMQEKGPLEAMATSLTQETQPPEAPGMEAPLTSNVDPEIWSAMAGSGGEMN